MITTVPDVVHICARCGELASGECRICRRLEQIARAEAAGLLERGLGPERVTAGIRGAVGSNQQVAAAFEAMLAEEYHRQRRARFYGALPRVDADRPRPVLRDRVQAFLFAVGSWALIAAFCCGFWSALGWAVARLTRFAR